MAEGILVMLSVAAIVLLMYYVGRKTENGNTDSLGIFSYPADVTSSAVGSNKHKN